MPLQNETEIKDKIYNVDLLLIELKTCPGTYKSILGIMCNDGTCNIILRRKINRLHKSGVVCKTTIPGTRFGEVIFYHPEKKYNIIVESGRLKNDIYYFFKYVKLNNFFIQIEECYQLKNNTWEKELNKTLSKGNILKWI